MTVGTATEGPVIFALALLDRQVVDAGDAPPHQAVFVELPVLVAIAAKPAAGIVVPFICKAHGDPVVAERPHLLNQPIIELAIPFAREKRLDRLAAVNELGAVAPYAVDGIGEGDAGGVASVPGIFGKARLLRGGLGCERRQRWAGHRLTPACSSSLEMRSINRPEAAFRTSMVSARQETKTVGPRRRWNVRPRC